MGDRRFGVDRSWLFVVHLLVAKYIASNIRLHPMSRADRSHDRRRRQVHLINLTGLKKRDPTSERLRYCDEIIDDILDSADNPLTVRPELTARCGAGIW